MERTMRLTAQGWHRDHGPTELFDIDLNEVAASTEEISFSFSPALGIELNPHPSARGAVRSVTLYCFAQIRLGGNYNVKLKINKSEIARLFYLTHKREIDGLFGVFPCDQDGSDEKAA
jgi:hypothetical protein